MINIIQTCEQSFDLKSSNVSDNKTILGSICLENRTKTLIGLIFLFFLHKIYKNMLNSLYKSHNSFNLLKKKPIHTKTF